MRIISIIGLKDAGKTTLLVALAREFHRQGKRVATIKHATHPATLDRDGTDSYRHFHEGLADGVLIASPTIRAVFERRADDTDPETLARRYFPDRDLVLVEGFGEGVPAGAVGDGLRDMARGFDEAAELCDRHLVAPEPEGARDAHPVHRPFVAQLREAGGVVRGEGLRQRTRVFVAAHQEFTGGDAHERDAERIGLALGHRGDGAGGEPQAGDRQEAGEPGGEAANAHRGSVGGGAQSSERRSGEANQMRDGA